MLAVHDVGRAVNPMLCEGQIQGSVHMGLGYALSEDFPADELGRPRNMTLRSLGILRPKDVPPIAVVLVEEPNRAPPTASKGSARSASCRRPVPWQATLHDLDGTWRASLPMSFAGAAAADPAGD